MLTQPQLDLNVKFNGLVWPVGSLYVVVYFKRSNQGVWASEPEMSFFESALKVELFLFDLATDTYRDTGAAYTGLVYLKGAQGPTVFKYP